MPTLSPINVDKCLLGDAGDEELFQQALDIVQQLHQRGVIHGDLDPQNFIICAREPKHCPTNTAEGAKGELMIIDFGCSSFSSKQRERAEEIKSLKEMFADL